MQILSVAKSRQIIVIISKCIFTFSQYDTITKNNTKEFIYPKRSFVKYIIMKYEHKK